MKHKILIICLLIFGVFTLYGESIWEGSAAMSQYGEFPTSGFYGASNAFPRNTVVKVKNPLNDKSVNVIIVQRLNEPGIFLLLSPEAADEVGIEKDEVVQVQVSRDTEDYGLISGSADDMPYNLDVDLNPSAGYDEPITTSTDNTEENTGTETVSTGTEASDTRDSETEIVETGTTEITTLPGESENLADLSIAEATTTDTTSDIPDLTEPEIDIVEEAPDLVTISVVDRENNPITDNIDDPEIEPLETDTAPDININIANIIEDTDNNATIIDPDLNIEVAETETPDTNIANPLDFIYPNSDSRDPLETGDLIVPDIVISVEADENESPEVLTEGNFTLPEDIEVTLVNADHRYPPEDNTTGSTETASTDTTDTVEVAETVVDATDTIIVPDIIDPVIDIDGTEITNVTENTDSTENTENTETTVVDSAEENTTTIPLTDPVIITEADTNDVSDTVETDTTEDTNGTGWPESLINILANVDKEDENPGDAIVVTMEDVVDTEVSIGFPDDSDSDRETDTVENNTATATTTADTTDSVVVSDENVDLEADTVVSLKKDSWYIQLGAYKAKKSMESVVKKIKNIYPVAIMEGENRIYKLLVGPLTKDEKGTLLYLLKAEGFKDAFILKR